MMDSVKQIAMIAIGVLLATYLINNVSAVGSFVGKTA
jgi:hypothetical protein